MQNSRKNATQTEKENNLRAGKGHDPSSQQATKLWKKEICVRYKERKEEKEEAYNVGIFGTRSRNKSCSVNQMVKRSRLPHLISDDNFVLD